MNTEALIDMGLNTFKYSDNTFEVSISNFDRLNRNPILIRNEKTKNERIFSFDQEDKDFKIFRCDNLILIVKRYVNG